MNRVCAFRISKMIFAQTKSLNPRRGVLGLLFACIFSFAAFTNISSLAEEKPKTVPELIKELEAEDKFVKRKAAEELGGLGAAAKPAVPALIHALDDRDQQVWFHSVMALARLGPDAAEAIPALISSLDNSRGQRGRDAMPRQVRYRTAYALGRIGPAAIPELVKALESEKTSLRSGAAKALGFMGQIAKDVAPQLVAKLNDSDSDVRQQAAEALGQIGQPAILHLVPALSAPETSARIGATLAIGLIGPSAKDAAQPLADLYQRESDNEVRVGAIEALSKIRYDEAKFVPLLLSALKSSDYPVRHAAVNGLLLQPAPEKTVVQPLLDLLQQGDPFVKEQAAYALGRIGPSAKSAVPLLINSVFTIGEEPPVFPFSDALVQIGSTAVPSLIEALQNQKIEDVRKGHWTVRCLTAIGEVAVPTLLRALEDKHPVVRLAAIETLRNLKVGAKSAETPLLKLAQDPVPEIRSSVLLTLSALDAHSQTLIPTLAEALKDQSPQVRASAASALANAGADAKSAVKPLIAALSDSDLSVRKGAAKAVGAIGDAADSAVPALTAALKDGDKALRAELIRALGKVGAPAAPAVPRLIEFIDDDSQEIRATLLASLGSIGPGAKSVLPSLLKSVKDPNPEIRANAVAAFAKIESDGKTVLPILDEALGDASPAVRKVAAESLGKLGEAAEEVAPKVFALLKSDEDRPAALDSLRQIKIKSVSLLTETLTNGDPSVRLFACEALGRLGPQAKEAIPALRKALNDDYDIVRRQARMALRRIEDEPEKKPSP